MNVVGPAVQKNDRSTARWPEFGIADIQDAGIDLPDSPERRLGPRLDRTLRHSLCLGCLRCRRADHPKPSGGCGDRGGAKETASMWVDRVDDLDRMHWAALNR